MKRAGSRKFRVVSLARLAIVGVQFVHCVAAHKRCLRVRAAAEMLAGSPSGLVEPMEYAGRISLIPRPPPHFVR
jgi:hypothetical protein